jgi:hypothetical protein
MNAEDKVTVDKKSWLTRKHRVNKRSHRAAILLDPHRLCEHSEREYNDNVNDDDEGM